jgi:hypothetical protein
MNILSTPCISEVEAPTEQIVTSVAGWSMIGRRNLQLNAESKAEGEGVLIFFTFLSFTFGSEEGFKSGSRNVCIQI